ncbi:hypothetical protein GQ457_16G010830 [Hibiscus cannabinus]
MKEIKTKIGGEIDGLRYRWMTCHDPVRYSAITLRDDDDDDVGIMIQEHESSNIQNIELYIDVPDPSRNLVGNLAQISFDNEFDMSRGSFVAMLESGTSSAFHPFGGPSTSSAFYPFLESSTYATPYEPMNNQFPESIADPTVDVDVENLRGRWGETLEDSSEDEDVDDPDLFPDDIGDAPNFSVGEFISTGNDITWYEPPAQMDLIDFNAMMAYDFPDMSQLNSSQSGEFSVGIQFDENNEATLAIKEYSIKKHVDYVVVESSPKTFFAKCVKYGEECNWKIRVSKIQKKNAWVVTKYNGSHTCLRTSINQDHRKLDSNVISYHVTKLVEANPRVLVSVIQANIVQLFGYQIKYSKGWRARDKAMKSVYDDYDKSYNELPALLQAMTLFIPGTIVRYQLLDAKDRDGQLVQGHKFFHRLFWAFKPCIEGFPFCKRMVQVDGTWLYGRYSHVLLIAVAQDGDNNIFPIAFAIVEQETAEAWNFFLSNLREHVVQEDGASLFPVYFWMIQ